MARDFRPIAAALFGGLVLGIIIGVGLATELHVTSRQWWSLAGSAGGAIVAIGGAIVAYHYQAATARNQAAGRIRSQINEAINKLNELETIVQSPWGPTQELATGALHSMQETIQKAIELCSDLQSGAGQFANVARLLGELRTQRIEARMLRNGPLADKLGKADALALRRTLLQALSELK
ncbi:MAG: hypothetical protein NVS3B5_01900 [Sphingomicrobium sp.]